MVFWTEINFWGFNHNLNCSPYFNMLKLILQTKHLTYLNANENAICWHLHTTNIVPEKAKSPTFSVYLWLWSAYGGQHLNLKRGLNFKLSALVGPKLHNVCQCLVKNIPQKYRNMGVKNPIVCFVTNLSIVKKDIETIFWIN